MFGRPAWEDRVFNPSLVNSRRPSSQKTYFSVYARSQQSRDRLAGASSSSRSGVRRREQEDTFAPGLPSGEVPGRCPCCGAALGGEASASGASAAASPAISGRPPSAGLDKDASAAASGAGTSGRPPGELDSAELTAALVRDWTEPDTVRAHRRLERERKLRNGPSDGKAVDRSNVLFPGRMLPGRSKVQHRGKVDTGRTRSTASKSRPSKEPQDGSAVKQPEAETPGVAAEKQPTAPEEASADTKPAEQPPQVKGKGKAKGKDKASPPPPPSGGKGASKSQQLLARQHKNPFSRRLDWRTLAQEGLEGTVFQDLSDSDGRADPLVDTALLQEHFGHRPDPSGNVLALLRRANLHEIKILSDNRAQNMLIALRRRPLTVEIVKALETMDFSSVQLSLEHLEILQGAVPTAEESKLLLAFAGEVSDLRTLERQLLPLARLRNPCVAQRVQMAVLGCTMEEKVASLKEDISIVHEACRATRDSRSMRRVLRHLLHLGNMLNSGVETGEFAAKGFSLDVLPRLKLCRAPGKACLTLLHVLVAQVWAQHDQMPQALVKELSGLVRFVAWKPLNQLAEDVAEFCSQAALAGQCVRLASGTKESTACPSTQQFYIGDDDTIDESISVQACESPSCRCDNRHIARCQLRWVYARVSRQAPRALCVLAALAAVEAQELRAALAAAREQAASTLAFYCHLGKKEAQPHPGCLPDAKCAEFFGLLRDFIEALAKCVEDLSKNPELARQRHSRCA
eukprot:TRINITY_DN4635_c0_g1_i1.p1 TRINITY_DN4635_c0_g1~~TRINITY_DN4635_c0_g1_i1.p1  ORF type:complete len:744 (+),score=155.54 TRINITY_DN4635_c0_g1_i1:77-2308(+)